MKFDEYFCWKYDTYRLLLYLLLQWIGNLEIGKD